MALKENSRKVFDYVKAHEGEDFTAKDIAAALDLAVQSVKWREFLLKSRTLMVLTIRLS